MFLPCVLCEPREWYDGVHQLQQVSEGYCVLRGILQIKIRKWDDTEWHEPTTNYMDVKKMKPPILLVEVIENAQAYNSEIRIAKDCDRFYAYVLGRGFTRNFWMSASQLEKAIRDLGFTGTIIVE